MSARVALVTDSTASLPAAVARARGIEVVPLQVVIGGTAYDEGETGETGGATPELLAEALEAWVPVSTSRPNPERLLEAYAKLAAEGFTEIVSIHLSGDLSGTVESAQLAARKATLPVTVVDSRQVGIATGFCVLAAAQVITEGGSVADAVDAARLRSASTTSLFYVDTLEYLRRGGRVGAAAALLGSALAVKPILRVEDGRIRPFERVRTSTRALARLEELAVEAAGEGAGVDVAVAHLASPQRAHELADRLAGRMGERLAGALAGAAVGSGGDKDGDAGSGPRSESGAGVFVGEVGAVLGAHVGPGMVAVCVSPGG